MTPSNTVIKILKNRSYGQLAGGKSLQFASSSFTFVFHDTPKALRSYKRNELWWAVEFDCEYLGNHSALRNKIETWMYNNCLQGTTHLPRYANYAGFRKEEDALMCYLAFC